MNVFPPNATDGFIILWVDDEPSTTLEEMRTSRRNWKTRSVSLTV
jgi:hypothetical protein